MSLGKKLECPTWKHLKSGYINARSQHAWGFLTLHQPVVTSITIACWCCSNYSKMNQKSFTKGWICTTNWCPRHELPHILQYGPASLLTESDYKIPPLRWTLQHKYLQANASMLISAFSRDPHSLGESHNHVDESLSCNKYPELPCQIPTLSTYSSVNFRGTLNPPEWRDMWTASHLKFNFPIQ